MEEGIFIMQVVRVCAVARRKVFSLR
jgi:hypothetical protein